MMRGPNHAVAPLLTLLWFVAVARNGDDGDNGDGGFFVTALSSPGATKTMQNSKTSPIRNANVPGLKNGMDYARLGDSDLVVSKVCMGTMTFGEQNTIEDGVEQLTKAFDTYGCNFLDTAEMYPVPTKAETQGRTDAAVCKFLQVASAKREDIVLATKVSGRSERINWLPRREEGVTSALTKEQIIDSVEASLKRLGTDYIDLLQFHWPDRYAGGLFGQGDFSPSVYQDGYDPTPFEEQLSAVQQLVQDGKVRYLGVSNETPYGVSSMVNLAKQFPDLYPKIVSIQNSYSLVVRKDYEAGLGEVCYHDDVGLLAYSPLAGGSLSGKYRDINQASADRARLTLFPGFMDRYLGSLNEKAVNAYCDLAEQDLDITPSTLALSWCYHNEHVTSSIIGATTMKQLDENFAAYDVKLSDEAYEKIGQIYKRYTDPTKSR